MNLPHRVGARRPRRPSTLRILAAFMPLAAGALVLTGCSSGDEATDRQAGGLLAKDVIGVVCNLTPEVIRVTMTSTKPGKSPANLANGDCISSRPQDAGGDSQFSTSLGDSCGVRATVRFPARRGAVARTETLGFFNVDFGSGVQIGKGKCNGNKNGASVSTTPGSSTVISVHGYPVKVMQWPAGAYAQIGFDIYAPGTAPEAMG